MEVRYRIFVYPASRKIELLEAVQPIGLPPPLIRKLQQSGRLAADLLATDARLARLRKQLKKHRFTFIERQEFHYSRDELVNFPLLRIAFDKECAASRSPKTRYELGDACPNCGTGANQVSQLVLKNSSKLPGDSPICQINTREILSRGDLRRSMERMGFAGLELREAVNVNGRRLNWWQWIAPATLPPMSDRSMGIKRWNPCPSCDRDGYFHRAEAPPQIVYSKKLLRDFKMMDFIQTWEWFGKSGLSDAGHIRARATPHFLVTPRVMTFFDDRGVPNLQYWPVSIA